jgi:hypothetical protein
LTVLSTCHHGDSWYRGTFLAASRFYPPQSVYQANLENLAHSHIPSLSLSGGFLTAVPGHVSLGLLLLLLWREKVEVWFEYDCITRAKDDEQVLE